DQRSLAAQRRRYLHLDRHRLAVPHRCAGDLEHFGPDHAVQRRAGSRSDADADRAVRRHRDAGGGSVYPIGDTLTWDGFSWSLRPTATRPYPVENPSMAFDSVAGRLLLCTTDATNTQSYFWEWSGSNWQQRAFSPTPAGGGVLVRDPAHN